MKLVERHIIKDRRFEDICLKSGLLHNYVLYNVRQGIFSGNYLKEEVHVTEESYTSKVDHLAFEPLEKHESYVGKRMKRGLFQSSTGKLLNADVNGAIGIGRKVFGDSFVRGIIGSGFAENPIRFNTL